ncbi:LytTR family DNA-binding domain-containing protein, partial [Daejeonella sp.]|uniref:LytR/AlgR family response regulator transcription factor n=1 Tax=Daejeonella sp. TaxID=2805397 RepID=UPI00272F05CE
ALDYLLKPVSFDRFLRAMEKVYEHFGFTARQNIQTGIMPARNQDIFLYLKVERKMVKVDVKDILWIESQKDYIKVVLTDKELISKQKISILEELLPEDEFLRIHRSFIISMNKIESFNSSKIEIGAKELPIGRNYKNDCQRRLNHY